MMQLYGPLDSLWTERARWPLDHHHLPYAHFSGAKVRDVAKLRLLTRRPAGALPLPLLRDRLQVISGSFEIALHAERAGTGPRLVPDITAVVRWNRLGERALTAGQLLAERRIAADPAALRETLPEELPGPARALLEPLADRFFRLRTGVRGDPARVADLAEASLRDVLAQTQSVLAETPYLLGTQFTFADISMAVAINSIAPLPRSRALGAATRECWTQRALATEFPGLLEWRDLMYANHRAQSR